MKRRSLRYSWTLLPLLVAALLTVGLWTGCGTDQTSSVTGPSVHNPSMDLTVVNPAIQRVMAIQDRHTPELMQIDGVVGTATGVNANGEPVVKVYTARKLPEGIIPVSLDGADVETEVTGVIHAMKGPPGGGGGGGGGGGKVSHTAKQSLPIQLGTSGGWAYDLANGYCCGGTLGSLVQKGGTQYILSNYHVLEADIVNGGNNRVAEPGDPVIQPGLIDVGCNLANAQTVATLDGTKSLPSSNVDCAIAAVVSGAVDPSGAILEIGTISSSTVAASVGQAVKKSGRTTGLSRSSVSGLNATVSVSYENECAGGTAFTKTFTGQIIIDNKGSKFLDSGDSGSLMVEDVNNNPRAVGLLFAGSRSAAVANPINQVLSFLGASMVGN
jgi:hypothetical protein